MDEILVRTGKAREEWLSLSAAPPDRIIDSLAEPPALL